MSPARDVGGVPSQRLRRARALMAANRYAQALDELSRCLADDPGHAGAWAGLGKCRVMLRDWSGALEAADRALSLDPTSTYAWLIRCRALMALNRAGDAVHAAEEALRLDPEAWQACHHLAVASASAGDWPGALRAASRTVELAPAEAEAHCMLGLVALRTGESAMAEAALRTTLRLAPDDGDALVWLTVMRLRRGRSRYRPRRLAGAAAALADAAAMEPFHRTARAQLGHVLALLARPARWLGALCLLIGLIGAAVSGAGTGDPPRSGDLAPRLIALASIGAALSAWVWWLAGAIPPRLRRPLLRHALHVRAVLPAVGGSAALILSAVFLVAAPWSHPATVGAAVLVPVALQLLLGLAGRRLPNRWN